MTLDVEVRRWVNNDFDGALFEFSKANAVSCATLFEMAIPYMQSHTNKNRDFLKKRWDAVYVSLGLQLQHPDNVTYDNDDMSQIDIPITDSIVLVAKNIKFIK